jgi:hypothetical protein
VVIFGQDVRVHNDRLREVFIRMRNYNMKLQPDKCEFLRKEVSYLEHVIGQDGVRPDETRIEAVRDYPQPKTTYYRRFIPNFSKTAKPLTELLKDTSLVWSEKTDEAFSSLKPSLTEPLLQYPDILGPLYGQPTPVIMPLAPY